MGLHGWEIERQVVFAIEDAPRDIEIDVWMEGDNSVFLMASKR